MRPIFKWQGELLMRWLTIAGTSVRIISRDRKAILTLLGMPLLFIAILGTALGPVFGDNTGDTEIPRFKVALADLDSGALGEGFVEKALQVAEVQALIEVERVDDRESARVLVESGKVPAAIVLLPPAGGAPVGEAGRMGRIELMVDPARSTLTGVVRAIVDTFAAEVAVSVTEPKIASAAASMPSKVKVTETTLTARPTPSALQYYSAGMAIMFLLFTAVSGSRTFHEERRIGTFARMLAAPTTKLSVVAGKFAGVVLLAAAQFIILMAGTRLFFGVRWGATLPTLALGLAFVFAVSGISLCFAAFVKNERTADTVGSIAVQILSALGGSMLPVYLFPDLLRNIARVAPNIWALEGFLSLMSGGAFLDVLPAIGVLTFMGCIYLSVGAWRLRTQ